MALKYYSSAVSKINFVQANSAGPDVIPPYAAFHRGLHCL